MFTVKYLIFLGDLLKLFLKCFLYRLNVLNKNIQSIMIILLLYNIAITLWYKDFTFLFQTFPVFFNPLRLL